MAPNFQQTRTRIRTRCRTLLVRFDGMDAHLARFETDLASQHGLVTLDQLLAGDVDVNVRRRLVENKSLRRIRPGVYGLVGAKDTWERGLLAAVLSIDDSVASHSSAARLWAFDPRPEGGYEVTVRRDTFLERPGVSMHRSGTIADEDLTHRDGIPTTSFERTLCDCTTLLGERPLGRVLDDGLRRRVGTLRRLERCAERLESAPGRRMTIVRALLAERGIGFDPGGSASELRVLDVLRRAATPAARTTAPREGRRAGIPAGLRLAAAAHLRRVLRPRVPYRRRRRRCRQ